jgi:hypothetical protein
MNRTNEPKKFQIHSWGKEIEDWVKIPLEGENRWENQRHRFLGSWIYPRIKGFHVGFKKLPMGRLGEPSRLFLRRGEWKEWRGKNGVSSVQVYEPMKTRQSGLWNRIVWFCLNRQNFSQKDSTFLGHLEGKDRLETGDEKPI